MMVGDYSTGVGANAEHYSRNFVRAENEQNPNPPPPALDRSRPVRAAGAVRRQLRAGVLAQRISIRRLRRPIDQHTPDDDCLLAARAVRRRIARYPSRASVVGHTRDAR